MKSRQGDYPFLRKEFHLQILASKSDDFPVVSSVSYHSLLCNLSVPLVPWNCEQASTCKDLKFLQLLHKLGFHMPVDSGKVFIRIPHFWNAEILYEVAGKILPVDKSKLKFSTTDITDSISGAHLVTPDVCLMSKDISNDVTMIDAPENFYQVHKQKHLATMVNFTPMPGSSFNSDGEPDKHTWFDLIRKSQDFKLSLNLKSHRSEAEEADAEEHMCSEPSSPAPLTEPSPLLLLPSLPPVMSVKHESFTTQLADSEYYNNSVCETASVASDLTRMYVSDEDEKSEVLILPVIGVDPAMDESSDLDINNAGKRPRVQFSTPF